jgi:hypothetical protein
MSLRHAAHNPVNPASVERSLETVLKVGLVANVSVNPPSQKKERREANEAEKPADPPPNRFKDLPKGIRDNVFSRVFFESLKPGDDPCRKVEEFCKQYPSDEDPPGINYKSYKVDCKSQEFWDQLNSQLGWYGPYKDELLSGLKKAWAKGEVVLIMNDLTFKPDYERKLYYWIINEPREYFRYICTLYAYQTVSNTTLRVEGDVDSSNAESFKNLFHLDDIIKRWNISPKVFIPFYDEMKVRAQVELAMMAESSSKENAWDAWVKMGYDDPAPTEEELVRIQDQWGKKWLEYKNDPEYTARAILTANPDNKYAATFLLRWFSGSDPTLFGFVSERLKDDDQVAYIAVKENAVNNIKLVSNRLRDNDEFMKKLIKFSPISLKWASDRIKSNLEFAMHAVQSNPYTFPFLAPNVKEDPDIAYLAVKGFRGNIRLVKNATVVQNILTRLDSQE